MFTIFLTLSIMTGIGLGAWLAIKHGEEFARIQDMVRFNMSLAVAENVPDDYYDREEVNEYDQESGKNDDQDFMQQESYVTEEEENVDSELPLNTVKSTMPESQTAEVEITDRKNSPGEGTEIVNEPNDGAEPLSEPPQNWDSNEKIEELVQMVNFKNMPEELRSVIFELQEIQNLFSTATDIALNQEDVESILSHSEAKYMSRVICRPKLGSGKERKPCH